MPLVPRTIEGADIDGDGDNDLVVSRRPTSSTNGGIFVLYNPGDGLAADEIGMTLNGWWGNPNSMQKLVSPTSALGVARKAAGAAAKKVPAAPAKYVKVVDVDNDGYTLTSWSPAGWSPIPPT